MSAALEIKDASTPVVVVNCKLGALAIMRSLGPLGVPLYGVDPDPPLAGDAVALLQGTLPVHSGREPADGVLWTGSRMSASVWAVRPF